MPSSDIERRLVEVENQLQEIRKQRIPGGGVTDPAPDEWWSRYPFPRWPRYPLPFPFPFPWNPVVDPQPEPWNTGFGGFENQATAARRSGGVFGPNVDPSPIDFSRFTEIQLRGVKDMITLERKRLEALDLMIDEKIAGHRK